MNAKVQILDQYQETFDTKKGTKTLQLLSCLDVSVGGGLRNTFDYELTPEEMGKIGAGAVGKMAELNIKNIQQTFNGRLRVSGTITIGK